MAESFHNRMSKIFSYISEDEDKKIVLFEKRLYSYLYKILVNTVKGTLMMWAAWREKSSQGRKKHPKSSLRRNLFKTGWASLSHSGKSSRWGEKRTGSCFCVSSSNSHSVLTALGLWRGWKKLCAAMKGLRRKVWKGWGQSAKLGTHSAICSKLGAALQAYALNPCTKFPPNPTSRKVNT